MKYKFNDCVVVELGDVVELCGVKVEVNENLVKNNPTMFVCVEIPKYFKCIRSLNKKYWTIGKIYKHESFDKYPLCIKIKSNEGEDVDMYNWDMQNLSINTFIPLTKEEVIKYENLLLLETAKELYKPNTVVNNKNIIGYDCGFIIKENIEFWINDIGNVLCFGTNLSGSFTIYCNGVWAEIKDILFTTDDGVDIFKGDTYWYIYNNTVCCIVGAEHKVDVNDGTKRFSTKALAENHLKNKNLKYYERVLQNSEEVVGSDHTKYTHGYIYFYLKTVNPKLYWTAILQEIANDLNGDWKVTEDCEKFMIGFCEKNNWKPTVIKHNSVIYADVYFKSKEAAEQAINIMGSTLSLVIVSERWKKN